MFKPSVSEHALFRYLERSGRIDVKALQQEILTPEVKAACKAGARSIRVNGFTFIIDRGSVVTVIDAHKSNRRAWSE